MKKILFSIFLSAVLAIACGSKDIIEERYLASATTEVTLYSIDENGVVSEAQTMVRGRKVKANYGKGVRVEKQRYYPIEITRKQYFYAKEQSLVATPKEVVQEKVVWVRTPASIITDRETSLVGGQAQKGEKLSVLDFDSLRADGVVNRYKIKQGKTEGYIYGKYLVFSKEEAEKRYKAEQYDKVHKAIKNPFGGGEAFGCDFYPTERVKFADNKMPEACYSLYLNISPSVIGNIEKYIDFAKKTKINTFVIDIKDNECPGYKAEAMAKYSPTNHRYAGKNKEEMYRNAVKRLHEEGFYVVGRITCFKDSHLVKDHPEVAITEKATGKPFKHNKAYWPSPYNRKVWQFNVELAKEAVRKFGFNEINFDYVRFPDRMTKVEKLIDYHNKYGESKVQAIQRFVQYACDEIHAVGAYVSIDVFGEAANPGYTTAYGQYWPAISNICDAICGMPYPDHFSNGYYGIKQPWNHPYEILKAWGERVQARQAVTPTPATVRTWVQAYPVMRHVDRNGLRYDAEDVEKEIRGLYDAGLTGGYTTWHSGSNLEKYKAQKEAFCIDYLKEWKKSNKK
ncbi:MAG: hypothetical protein E7140_06075 [Rikenellaceae bacterium]|nr:hypothetical protein [Rikenellaceae bacterium]